MLFLEKELNTLNLPEILVHNDGQTVTPHTWEKRRDEIKSILQMHEFGNWPSIEDGRATGKIISCDHNYMDGSIIKQTSQISFKLPDGTANIDVDIFIPKSSKTVPMLNYISFEDAPSFRIPIEEICNRGFAISVFNYQKAIPDTNDNFTGGIAPLFGKREKYSPSKIVMWAYCASKIMDYIETVKEIDNKNVAVIGHSRLGKTALVAAAFDERFKYVFSNDSGCGGAGIARKSALNGGKSETVKAITTSFPFWFSGEYFNYIDNEQNMPFDQHYLLSAIAPRYLYVASALSDDWACPNGEFLGAYASSKVWDMLGKKGLIGDDKYPTIQLPLQEGCVAYHIRIGKHFISRYDWNNYMDFINKKTKKI